MFSRVQPAFTCFGTVIGSAANRNRLSCKVTKINLKIFDMKTKIMLFSLFAAFSTGVFAQDRTTVTATTDEISDNLDLRAVASIFGDSRNLEDFEQRLNDPDTRISNLDLNMDNQVDYLRVVESVESSTHLIIIQAVLERDVFQDVATIEVEKDRSNRVQIQVVGDVYMYGPNYIYEPVYVSTPVIYSTFWAVGYRPYWSSWYWGYYPHYWYVWRPIPVYRYYTHIHHHINVRHHYNYVNVRTSSRAIAMHSVRRANAYEVRHPERSFTRRHTNVSNYRELQQSRSTRGGNRNQSALTSGTRNSNVRSNSGTRNENVRATGTRSGSRSVTAPRNARSGNSSERSNSGSRSVAAPANRSTETQTRGTRSVTTPSRSESGTRTAAPRTQTPRVESPRTSSPRVETPRTQTPRVETPRQAPRVETPRQSPRMESPRTSQRASAPSSGRGGSGGRR
jgi:hypothetical protein